MEQPAAGLLQRLKPRGTDEGFNQAADQFDEVIQAARAPTPEIDPQKKPRAKKGAADAVAGVDDSPAAEQGASAAPRSQTDAPDPQGDNKNGA
jgi:hypothetical protein